MTLESILLKRARQYIIVVHDAFSARYNHLITDIVATNSNSVMLIIDISKQLLSIKINIKHEIRSAYHSEFISSTIVFYIDTATGNAQCVKNRYGNTNEVYTTNFNKYLAISKLKELKRI